MDEQFEESIELAPAVMTLRALLNEGLSSLPRSVRSALDDGDYSEALSAANDAYSSRGPEARDVALAYAVLLVGRNLADEALGVLQRVLKNHAQDVGLQLAQAEALLMNGDFDEAQSLLEGLESVSTLEPRHDSFVGDMYLDLGDQQRAIDAYRRALERGHESAEVAYRLARLFEERQQLEPMAHYLEIAARAAGDNPMLWEAASEALYEVGRVDDAAACWERMLEFRPHDVDSWFMLGLSYWYLDRFGDAAEAFEKVVDLNPRHRTAWRQLGDVWLTIGHGEKALHAFREALELDGDDIDALNGAVLAAYETGDVSLALTWAQRAMEIAPEDRQTRYHYGLVLLSRGRAKEAREIFSELVDSEEEDVDEYLGALAVASLKTERIDEGFEHIDELLRLDGRAEWLASFAEELIKLRGAQEAIDFMERADVSSPQWRLVRPFLTYVCSVLLEDEKRADDDFADFRRIAAEYADALPVLWNFEAWEAMAFRLDTDEQRRFDQMLAVVEGRAEVESLHDR